MIYCWGVFERKLFQVVDFKSKHVQINRVTIKIQELKDSSVLMLNLWFRNINIESPVRPPETSHFAVTA